MTLMATSLPFSLSSLDNTPKIVMQTPMGVYSSAAPEPALALPYIFGPSLAP